jgi:hypothetical protein
MTTWVNMGDGVFAEPETAKRMVETQRRHDEAFKKVRGKHFRGCKYFPSEEPCTCDEVEALARILLWANDESAKEVVAAVLLTVKMVRHELYPDKYAGEV